MPDRLRGGNKVVGVRQTLRALEGGRAETVFLAGDADPRVIEPIALRAEAMGIEVASGMSMKVLGLACGIKVPAAVAALIHA